MKEVLSTLAIGKDLDEASFSHPPINRRLKKIDRYTKKKLLSEIYKQ